MKNFYNRDNELELLWRIKERSQKFGQFTLVTGRKGIGKTRLLANADLFRPTLYFFIEEKGEALLCDDFDLEIRSKLRLMEFKYLKTFEDVFNYLIELAKTRDFTLVVDDFQRLIDINPEIYNEIMDWWGNRGYVRGINLILCGSVSSMSGVSKHGKEPLFDLTTARIHLQAFSISTLKEILSDHHPNYKQYNLLVLYTITGGVAQYVELLVKKRIFSLGFILDAVFAKSSFFLEEGKNVLRAKLEKDYVNYFSILNMIAESGRSHEYMKYMLGVPVEGLVDRLENELGLIEKVRPLFVKPRKRNYRYQIKDNFLNFWFYFVFKNSNYVESGELEYLKENVRLYFTRYSERFLKKYFLEKMVQEDEFTTIGTYWEKDNIRVIDIVAVNDLKKLLVFADVKLNKDRIRLSTLEKKSVNIRAKFPDYQVKYIGLSLEDM